MDLDQALSQLGTVLDVSIEQVEAINQDIKRVEDYLQVRHTGTYTDPDTGIAWIRTGMAGEFRLQSHDLSTGQLKPLNGQGIHQRVAAHKKLPAFVAALTLHLKRDRRWDRPCTDTIAPTGEDP